MVKILLKLWELSLLSVISLCFMQCVNCILPGRFHHTCILYNHISELNMKSFQNLSRLNFEGNSVICTLQKKSLKRKGLPSSHSNLRLVNIIKGNNHFCFVQFFPFMSCKCSSFHYWFMSTAYQVINWSYSFTKHQPTLFTSLHNVTNLIETFFRPL